MSDQNDYDDVVPTEDDAPVSNPAEFDEFNDDDNVGGNNPDDEVATEANPERTETFENPDDAGHPGTT